METFSAEKEEYLKLINYYQNQDGIARTGLLAKKLALTKSSVTEMFQKLSQENLVSYTPYMGVYLTKKGAKYVAYLRKKQALLSCFLETCLECSEEEVEEILNELEHINNQLFFDKLEQYLKE
ncbi:MAG TPA: metal-dependent transcriptional regulator [Enterococcus sp.]|nr:metal-dependent transcriptional regulator [Enterococcus sp.]